MTRPPKTFSAFIKEIPVWDNPQGDFIQDARGDRHLPDVKSWLELYRHLLRRGGSHLVDEARMVWTAYEALCPPDRDVGHGRPFGRTATYDYVQALEDLGDSHSLDQALYIFADAVHYAYDSPDAALREEWRPVVKAAVEAVHRHAAEDPAGG